MGPAEGQGLRLEGRVLRVSGTDSVPLPNAWVVLHEVTMDGGGPRDSVPTGRDGAYRIGVAAPDTTALYMVSTTYLGLAYFSQVRTARTTDGPLDPLVVFDTSSTGSAIAVAQRHIIIRDAEESNRRSVLELVALANDGDRTRIAGEPPHPTWVGRLPAGATNFVVGQGDVSAEAVQLVGDSIVVTAPIPPGVKQLVFTYEMPGGRELRLPVDQPAERLLVLLADTGAVVTDGPLMRRGVEVFDDTQFALFSGAAPNAGDVMVFEFNARRFAPGMAPALIAGVAAVLLLLAIPLLRRRSPEAVRAAPPTTPELLARAIAVLDAEHERGPRTAAGDAAYGARRSALKAQLADLLARGRGGA
ncbi:MAG: hypothetical protein OEW56_05575 [Gemmatimonadota bacterium]|nr:hypothetical protein [Gemmatimonadota bacterium]